MYTLNDFPRFNSGYVFFLPSQADGGPAGHKPANPLAEIVMLFFPQRGANGRQG